MTDKQYFSQAMHVSSCVKVQYSLYNRGILPLRSVQPNCPWSLPRQLPSCGSVTALCEQVPTQSFFLGFIIAKHVFVLYNIIRPSTTMENPQKINKKYAFYI